MGLFRKEKLENVKLIIMDFLTWLVEKYKLLLRVHFSIFRYPLLFTAFEIPDYIGEMSHISVPKHFPISPSSITSVTLDTQTEFSYIFEELKALVVDILKLEDRLASSLIAVSDMPRKQTLTALQVGVHS